MQNLFSMFVIGGVIGASALPAAACGGGGCSTAGGAYASGGRAVAYGKQAGRAPMLAQARPQTGRTTSGNLASHPTVSKTNAGTRDLVKSPTYTCPMHPQVQSTKPSDCPVCGMKLKLKPTKGDAAMSAPAVIDEHAGMDMGDMSGMPGMDDMPMCCPGCTMNMGGMFGRNAKQGVAPKASGRTTQTAGMGCGC